MRRQKVRSHMELADWRVMFFVLEKYLRRSEYQRSLLHIRAMVCNSSGLEARDEKMRAGFRVPYCSVDITGLYLLLLS